MQKSVRTQNPPASDLKRLETRLQKDVDNWIKHKPTLSAFYQWQIDQLTPIPIQPVADIKGLKEKIDGIKALLHTPLKLKKCYTNAWLLSKTIGDPDPIQYVEGFWLHDMDLCGHAWNSWRGQHFDVTGELLKQEVEQLGHPWDGDLSYFKVVELDCPSTWRAKHNSLQGKPLQIAEFLRLHKLPNDALEVGWNVVENHCRI